MNKWAWSYLEPEEGRFDWKIIDEPISKWTGNGLGVAFRISCKETGTNRIEQQFATPRWVRDAGAKGGHYSKGRAAGPRWLLSDRRGSALALRSVRMRRFCLSVCVAVLAAAGGRAASSAEGLQASALPALSVRGVNYYPRETPWGGMWTKTPAQVWEKDLALAASLGVNTVRTFLTFAPGLEQAGLLRHDGAPTPAYLDKVETFLAAAGRNGIRAILCFDFDPKSFAETWGGERWRRAVAAVVWAHREDARVLAWDLMNEPDDDAKWSDGTRAYLRDALALVRGIDTNHLTTVGMTWRIDRIREAGLPDLIQYHEYCPKRILFEQGPARVCQTLANQRKAGGGRPVLIGEFGLCTARDPAHGAEVALAAKMSEAPGTEAEQVRLYEIVLEAAEKEGVAGVIAWCLHDYPISNPNESHFGLIRGDGAFKPAALAVRRVFSRWALLSTGAKGRTD